MKERPVSKRPKMPLSQRAKQFAPFDALSGLSERLKQAEEEHSEALSSKSVRYGNEGEAGEMIEGSAEETEA